MDDLQPVRILDARNDLLEETTGFGLGHAPMSDDVIEELAAGVFEYEDDIGWC